MADQVVMTHSDLPNQEITVPRSAVPIHMASGWMPVEGKVASAEKGNVPTDVAPATEPDQDEAAAKSTTKRTASKES